MWPVRRHFCGDEVELRGRARVSTRAGRGRAVTSRPRVLSVRVRNGQRGCNAPDTLRSGFRARGCTAAWACLLSWRGGGRGSQVMMVMKLTRLNYGWSATEADLNVTWHYWLGLNPGWWSATWSDAALCYSNQHSCLAISDPRCPLESDGYGLTLSPRCLIATACACLARPPWLPPRSPRTRSTLSTVWRSRCVMRSLSPGSVVSAI